MHLRKAISIISAVATAGALAACGSSGSSVSSNGEASKSANTIVSDATTAMDSLQTVHVSGSTTTGSTPITLDLHLVNNKGGRGVVSEKGLAFDVIGLNRSVYIKASPSVWQHFGGAAVAQLLKGKWLKAPATGQFASFARLTNLHDLFSTLLSNHGTLAKGSTTTINGQKAIAINDKTRGGTLYVATTGKPYALRIAKSGAGGGHVDFGQFNQSVSLSPPPNAIDVSKLSGG